MASRTLPLIPWRKTGLLTEQKSGDSARAVHEAALHLLVLGYKGHVTTLLKTLYDFGHGLEFDLNTNMNTLYDAWEAFDCLPSWIEHPDTEKPSNGRHQLVQGEPLWNSYKDKWVEGLPETLRQKTLEQNHIEDAEMKNLFEKFENQSDDIMTGTTRSIGTMVQAATLAGGSWIQLAISTVETNILNLYHHFQDSMRQPDVYRDELRARLEERLDLHHAPRIWKYLKDANIGDTLRINSSSIDEYVEKGCQLIKQRFTEGPTRSCADQSIADLVNLLDEAKRTESGSEADDDDPHTCISLQRKKTLPIWREDCARDPV